MTRTQVDLTEEVKGVLPVGNGGSGAATLTGLVVGNGASAFTTVTAPTGTVVGTTDIQTETNKTLSDTYMGSVFDAQKVQRDTVLLASNDFIVLDTIEIPSTSSLEIPSTSSLEIIRYVTPTSVDNLSSKTLISPVIQGASVTGNIVPAAGNTYNLSDGTNYWNNVYSVYAWLFNLNLWGSSFYANVVGNNAAAANQTLTLPPATTALIDGEQFITLTSPYTLASQTAAQKLFNATTNGAITLTAGTYFFECLFSLSSMSSTSGGFGWDLTAGTAAISGIAWESEGNKATLSSALSAQNTFNTAANTLIVSPTTATVGWARITGKVRISVAGTVTPQVSLGIAAAAVVGADSYFRIWSVGSNTVTNVGNWS